MEKRHKEQVREGEYRGESRFYEARRATEMSRDKDSRAVMEKLNT